ncbi:MAG: tRNA 2-thiouridine(34) synthase MnmA [Chloroflexi bacterium]|nr:tRNA 2-thiouridine(34) synthase MnmA [Chloroflexota bacterium]
MSRIVVAMSGGVDSSLAAALLHERGEDVIGVWMRLVPSSGSAAPRCCGTDEAGELARRAADAIGIPFYALDYADVFGREVVDRFVRTYAAGETPNPCIACNAHVKFESLFRDVLATFAADRLATGHYARVTGEAGRRRLLKGRDEAKDQSYALYMLGQRELGRTLFPIGELRDKAETRAEAVRLGLPNAETPDSQDICFVDGDYRDFVRARAPEAFRAGPVERVDGSRAGTHAGIGTLTVGQRSGVGVATGERLYVLRLEPSRNAAVVGTGEEAAARRYEIRDVSFVADAPPAARFEADAVVRYRGTPIPATVTVDGDAARIELARAALVSPGQALVLYRGDEVVGGGVVR